jgi:hypothetical protein
VKHSEGSIHLWLAGYAVGRQASRLSIYCKRISMHALLAGDGLSLQQVRDALHVSDTDLTVVEHVRTEGELFLALRQLQPDVVVVDRSVRPDAPSTWFEYLQTLSRRSYLVWIDQDKVTRFEPTGQ